MKRRDPIERRAIPKSGDAIVVQPDDHVAKLKVARRRLNRVNQRIDELLSHNRDYSCTAFESSQAQLLVYMRRAERQVSALGHAHPDQMPDLERALHVTWDELGMATRRLVTLMSEITETAGPVDSSPTPK